MRLSMSSVFWQRRDRRSIQSQLQLAPSTVDGINRILQYYFRPLNVFHMLSVSQKQQNVKFIFDFETCKNFSSSLTFSGDMTSVGKSCRSEACDRQMQVESRRLRPDFKDQNGTQLNSSLMESFCSNFVDETHR